MLRCFFCFLLSFCVLSVDAKSYPNKEFVVVIDAGHGGKDAGATGSSEKNREKDINLAIALEVGRLLNNNQKDIKVIFTRKTDVFI